MIVYTPIYLGLGVLTSLCSVQQPDWILAKRSASPIGVDTRSPKRPPVAWTINSSGGDILSPDAAGRRSAHPRTQPTNGWDSCASNYTCVENNAAIPSSWTEVQYHQQLQHHQASGALYPGAAYPGAHVPISHGQPVISALAPQALGSSTSPPLPTSHVAASGLSYVSKTAFVPLGPVPNANTGADHSPSFSLSSSIPELVSTDASSSHLFPNMLSSVPNLETKLPVENQGPSHSYTSAYQDPEHHVQDTALPGFEWHQSVTSPPDPNNASANVTLSQPGYMFAPIQPGPPSYCYSPLMNPSLLSSFEYPLNPLYRSPYSVPDTHVGSPPAIDSQTTNFATYFHPTMPVAGGMFYNMEQQGSQDDQLHEPYVQGVHSGHRQHRGPQDLAADMGETMVADGEFSNGPAPVGMAGRIPQHLPQSFSPGNQSLAFPSPRNGLHNSLLPESARSRTHDGHLPDDSEGGSDTDVSGRADSESARSQLERKKRGPFDQDKRDKVNKTRKRGACLVCRIQRNEVSTRSGAQ